MTLYFACGWVIRPNVDYNPLAQMAAEAKCELAAISPLFKSKEGYMVMTFAVRMPSEAELVEFVKKVGVEYGMTHWYGVPQDYYASGQVFDLAQMPHHVLETWLAGMQKYGEYNEEIKSQLAKDTPDTP
jgi:hypothetical protein